MKTVLSFGGGIQTIAMVAMIENGNLKGVDEVVFADTGCEKPETYWYIENYIKEMLNVPFIVVKSHLGTLYEHCWSKRIVPSVFNKWCSDKFKIRPIRKHYRSQDVKFLIGYSADEINRSPRGNLNTAYPLIEMNIDINDCVRLIQEYGIPVPLRSSCYFCVFQPYPEWNWLKAHKPELVTKALELEKRHYERYPHLKDTYGLMKGTPLWKWGEGVQAELLFAGEKSCWSGHCGH